MGDLVASGAYLPYYRLERNAIASALATPPGRGTRSVASYDEDTTSMGVEAARRCLASAPDGVSPQAVVFATTDPAYLDKTNATAIHAALGLPDSVAAYDLLGSVRSAWGALRWGHQVATPTLVVLSDIRTGLPGSGDERDGGDGAAAFLFGDGADPLVTVIGGASSTGEFLDRWRTPGDQGSRVWEERFGEAAYVPMAEAALTAALKHAGLTAEAIDHLIVTGPHGRACRRVAASSGVKPSAIVDDLGTTVGNTGAAHVGILLADVLDRARPGEIIAQVLLADGADAVVLRGEEGLRSRTTRPAATVAAQVAAGNHDLSYPTFLTWRGQLHREPPRRPDPEPPAAPPSFRHEHWKFGFEASRCERCGTRHLPPSRVCVKCQAVDQMAPERLADVKGTIVTFTVDRLAFTLSPPVVAAVIDFDGGGRLQCELTDVDPSAVRIGGRVELTFRRVFTASNGVHNYFWKARPTQGGD